MGEWARWVLAGPDPAACEMRELLEICAANVNSRRHEKLLDKVRSADKDGVDSLLYELVAHELLHRLQLKPEFWPTLGSELTPDMTATVGGEQFIVDVFLVRNPSRTVKPFPCPGLIFPEGFQYTVDHGDRAKKIADRILEKHQKYAPTGKPMLLVVFLGDEWMQMSNVEEALYGAAASDGWLQDDFPRLIVNFRKELVEESVIVPKPGILLPDENNQPGCPSLSAVLACDWFYTLNRADPSRRMRCVVLHHWKPDVPIPPGEFGQFAEVAWTAKSSGTYEQNIIRSPKVAARFTGRNKLEFREYSEEHPW
ncbi:MAG: hypothetical protein ACRD2O_06340 [Terriglobia bacterium]